MINENNNKFYDFINMYNSIIKHYSNGNGHYTIMLFYIKDMLHLQITDSENNIIRHNCELECSKEESDLILNAITGEFILNHDLKYAIYMPMQVNDIFLYRTLGGDSSNIVIDSDYYINNDRHMQIHKLENTKFSLNIYLYNGIDNQTELLHKKAIKKINKRNEQFIYIKK